MKHFKLTTESKINIFGKKLFKIECIVDFKYAKKGELGGWIENENNVSDNAWVFGDAMVFGNAMVSGNAMVYGDAMVYGNARVYGNAMVSGNAEVYGDAMVFGNARVYGNAEVYGNARVYGNAISTKKVFTLNFVYLLTLTDNHISFGCIQKTVRDWVEWLKSDKIIETKRNTKKFKLIEMSLKLAIEQHTQLNNK